MRAIAILFILIFSSNLFALTSAEMEAQNKRSIQIAPGSTTTTNTFDNASGNTEIKDWNAKDYEENLGGNLDEAIENAKMLFDTMALREEVSGGNPNKMNNASLSGNEQTQYWDSASQDSLISGSTGGNASNNLTGTVKCYIARDVPIRYLCEKTGFVVSKQMESNGLEAKKTCDDNCFVQMPCIGLVSNPTVVKVASSNIELTNQTANTISSSKIISASTIIDYVSFDIVVDKKSGSNISDNKIKANLTITMTDLGENFNVLNKYSFSKTSESQKISINQYSEKIAFKIDRENNDVHVSIKNIEIVYKNNAKYACADLQDMSWLSPTNFGDKCPSGNLKSFTIGARTIQICADGPIMGDNRDGTYSNLEACEAVCKNNYECTMDTRITDTTLLQDYREGCIQGQTDCATDSVCEDLRLTGTKVLNENTFNARQEVKNTIVNSVQVQGVTRPRLMLRNDVDFQTKLAEEWKDEAYQYMLTNSTYGVSRLNLGEDTFSTNAYSYGIGSRDTDGLPVRSLYWHLKPKAFDVDSDVYFYAIVEVIVEKYSYTQYGTKIKTKDKILYVKTSNTNDYFKAFARKQNYAQILDGTISTAETSNDLSNWEYQTFNGTNWILLNKSSFAEYFKKEALTVTTPFIRIPVISDVKNFQTAIPGVIRSMVQVGAYETPFYSGSFNGTGETIAKYTQYVAYSKTKLTYEQIFDKINNGEITAIYDNVTPSMYTKNVIGDNISTTEDLNFYLYGKNNKKDGFVRMFPKQSEQNRKGYVFIFAY